MPSIYEKLDNLDRLIFDDATRTCDEIRNQLRQDTDQKLAGIKAEIEREYAQEYQRVTYQASLDKDARLSRANINARKMLLGARSDIIASVLDDLSERLRAFTKSDAYADYLMRCVREAVSRAGQPINTAPGAPSVGPAGPVWPAASAGSAADAPGDISVYLTPRDYEAYSKTVRAIAPGIDVRQGGEGLIGGALVENVRKGVYIDNTLKKKIELSVDELLQISSLTVGKLSS